MSRMFAPLTKAHVDCALIIYITIYLAKYFELAMWRARPDFPAAVAVYSHK